jgi:hypothetical protein
MKTTKRCAAVLSIAVLAFGTAVYLTAVTTCCWLPPCAPHEFCWLATRYAAVPEPCNSNHNSTLPRTVKATVTVTVTATGPCLKQCTAVNTFHAFNPCAPHNLTPVTAMRIWSSGAARRSFMGASTRSRQVLVLMPKMCHSCTTHTQQRHYTAYRMFKQQVLHTRLFFEVGNVV